MRTILFVDDEPEILEGLEQALRKEKLRILTAGSGAQALRILASEDVDVIVSDERMPSMSGADLLRRVRRDYPGVVRVMLTGELGLNAAVKVINDGVYRYLNKPVLDDELVRTIRSAVQMRELSDQLSRRPSARPQSLRRPVK